MRKAKIDTSPKIFEDYNELWEQNASEYYTVPVMEGKEIIGYRLSEVEEAEEMYRNIAVDFLDEGITTAKQIRKKYNYPIWVSMIIENKIEKQLDLYC